MFHEKLNRLIKAIDANNAQVAHYAGFDRTNVSRLRSGARVPRRDGPTAEKLVSGLYLFADDRNELGKLCTVFGGSPNASAEEIKAALAEWLYSGQGRERRERKRSAGSASFRSFGEKLDGVMTLAEIPNVRLSRLVNVDASLISRFRTGVRTPRSNPELTERLCHALFQRIREQERLPDLARLTGLSLSELEEESFARWLCDYGEGDASEVLAVERLLEGFDALPFAGQPVPGNALLPEPPAGEQTVYFGLTGFQAAVVRFLSETIRRGAEELWLYSDEPMDWMVKDPAFRTRWFGLMSACVGNGVHIRIIHNVDRDLEEMLSAINSWLPLYLSGRIEPYACRKRNDGRFSHTLFLCPGMACIEAFHVLGTEEEGVYHYHTEDAALAAYQRAYGRLLAESRPLLRLTDSAAEEMGGDGLIVLQSTLSLATMPESLVEKLGSPALRRSWERQRAAYEKNLQSAFLYECIPIPEEGELSEGGVPMEGEGGEPARYYTPTQYSAHIQNVIRLSERYPNYRFYALPEVPYPHMKLVLGRDYVSVSRTTEPFLTFRFSHPLICSAFHAYLSYLTERYKTDKNTLRRELGRYRTAENSHGKKGPEA